MMEKKRRMVYPVYPVPPVLIALVAAGSLALAGSLSAQEAFDPTVHCSGVTLDDVVIDFSQTLDLPADGVFCFRNFTVAAGSTLQFRRNALNTPVYILATEDIVIDGTIWIAGERPINGAGGRGGPGGFDGGVGGILGVAPPGAGHGPGGGLPGDEASPAGGDGGYGRRSSVGDVAKNGDVWGHPLLIPLVGGSGAGGSLGIDNVGTSGGGGGGGLLLAANEELALDGFVYAHGAGAPAGSGGAVRLVAPAVRGTGEIDAAVSLSKGHGRVRIDTFDRTGLEILVYGVVSFGSFVVAFPDPMPRLDLLHVAGENILPGAPQGVMVLLPPGSNPMQTVQGQAQNFPQAVTVEVTAIPDSGPPSTVSIPVAASTNTVVDFSVDVPIPANTITHVYAWVR